MTIELVSYTNAVICDSRSKILPDDKLRHYCSMEDKTKPKGKFHQALKYRDAALLIDHNQIDAIIGKGNDYDGMGKLDLTIIHYLQALDMDPTNSNALVGLGNVYFNMNLFGLSMWHYLQALDVDEDQHNALRGKLNVFHCSEENEKSEETKMELNKISGYNNKPVLKTRCPN